MVITGELFSSHSFGPKCVSLETKDDEQADSWGSQNWKKKRIPPYKYSKVDEGGGCFDDLEPNSLGFVLVSYFS